MSNKKLGAVLLSIAVVVIAGYGIFALTRNGDSESAVNQQTAATTPSSTQTDNGASDQTNTNTPNQEKTYTAQEVAAHSTESDCWTIIEGKVYDLTAYVQRHSGGDEILRACGIDGTSLFAQRQTDTGESVGSGTPHSNSAASQLKSLQVGVLVD